MLLYKVFQGSALPIPFQISDGSSNPITTYTGSEQLATNVWAGGNQADGFNPATTWVNPATGSVLIRITAAQSAALALGSYQIYSTLTASGQDPVPIMVARLGVVPTPGSVVSPPVYTSFTDLLHHAPWVGDLLAPEDESGFLEQQGKAREWLDEIIVSRYDYGNMSPTIGSPGFELNSMFPAGDFDFAPSKWVRDQLAANLGAGGGSTLLCYPKVLEMVACRSLFYILRPQMGSIGDISYRVLAREFARRSSDLVKSYRAELDLNGDGYADIIVNCGSTSLR